MKPSQARFSITNPMLCLGIGAFISSYSVPAVILVYDLPFKIFTALILLGLFYKFSRINKNHGLILIILFFIYLVVRTIYFPADVF